MSEGDDNDGMWPGRLTRRNVAGLLAGLVSMGGILGVEGCVVNESNKQWKTTAARKAASALSDAIKPGHLQNVAEIIKTAYSKSYIKDIYEQLLDNEQRKSEEVNNAVEALSAAIKPGYHRVVVGRIIEDACSQSYIEYLPEQLKALAKAPPMRGR